MMNSFFSAAALFAVLAVGSQAHAAPLTYNFKYTFVDTDSLGSSHVVTGSFDGNASGNLITGISNVSAFIDGETLGSPLFPDSYDTVSFNVIATGAVVSFDGLASDFIFASNATNLSNALYFYVIPWSNPGETVGNPMIGVQAVGPHGVIDAYNGQYVPANWSVTAAAAVAGVPEPASIALVGIALLGMGAATRKRGVKR